MGFLMVLFSFAEIGLADSNCVKGIGTRCSIFGKCNGSLREAKCESHPGRGKRKYRLCQCRQGYCAIDGTCTADESVCLKDTGGTCNLLGCHASRGPTLCVRMDGVFGHCMCPDGFCARAGKCVMLRADAISNELLLPVDVAGSYHNFLPGLDNAVILTVVSALAVGVAVSLVGLWNVRSRPSLMMEPLL